MAGEWDRFIARAEEWRGAKLAIATVLRTWGSSPLPRGSHMLVHEDGRFEGSVSGGCVEGEVLHMAAETIADGTTRRLSFGVGNANAWEVGLPCGGDIEILVRPVSASGFAPELFASIGAARTAGETLTIATDLASGRSRISTATDKDDWLNIYSPSPRVLIVGAVQIAQSLARIAAETGIAPVVIDPRDRFLTEDRFPNIARDGRWPDEAIAAHRPDSATAIVTLSHDLKIDDVALLAALRSPARYIAALGSRKSHATRCERLAARGVGPEDLQRIDGPAGLAIGALSPAEIALSIAAAMVAALRNEPPGVLSDHSPI